jgi:hypothetical protein
MSPRRFAAGLFTVTAPLWAFAVFVWCRSGFGFYPMIELDPDSAFGCALICSAPLWLAAVAGARQSFGAAWLRILCVPVLCCFFLRFGVFIGETVLFHPLDFGRGWWLLANLLLFRLPFALAFVATVLLCMLAVEDVRAGRHLPQSATAG